MVTEPSAHHLDALIAALLVAGAASNADATTRRVIHRAFEEGLISSNTIEPVEALAQLRAARNAIDKRSTVLIVEDDRLMAQILADELGAPARTILIARSAQEATARIREYDVDLILLDLVLPDGDGRDLLTELRGTAATRAVPVIVITGRRDDVTQAECFALGADTVLLKPVSPPVIAAAVSMHLGLSSERREEGRIDGLTQLPNRTAFLDAFTRAATVARRNNRPMAVGMIDLDHFKAVNDSYGHAVGDEVLHRSAQAVAATLRSSDLVARWGGEELCVLFPETTTSGAVQALEKALSAVRSIEFRSNEQVFSVTFSSGVAPLARTGPIEDCLSEADRLLYVAKSTGRNRVVSAADERAAPAPRVLLVEDDVGVASVVARLLERQGFSVAHFADGGSALAAAGAEHFVIALVDLNLPVVHGFDLVASMRKMATSAKMPILFLTGSEDEDDIVRGFQVGADDYISKPFHARELIARINRLLPKR